MNELNDLEFLANKSKDFIEKQVSSYRQRQSNSGSIIAVISLFITFFLNGLDDAYLSIKIASAIPIILFVYAIFLLIEVLKSKSLDHGFHTDKFQELAREKNYEKVLLHEIGANKSSFDDNKKIVDKATENFNLGIKITLVAVFISIFLLLTNKFFKPEKVDTPIKVKLVN